jgi:hypothetical protein
MLAVPAATCTSPQFRSSWYALIPAAPHRRIAPASRRCGRRTPRSGATSARAADATTSRAIESPATPSPSTPTRIAGNADAHTTTVAASASAALDGT